MTVKLERTSALRSALYATCMLSMAVLMPISANAQTVPPQYDQDGAVPQTVQELRRGMLASPVNSLTFRNLDQLFETRVVPRAGPVTPFRRADGPLPLYEFEGQMRGVRDFETRTFTNALLVVRDGTIVYESYLNNTDDKTHFASFSMAKSITSMLIGIAVDKGFIKSIDQDVTEYAPELKGTGYDGVTIRQVLQMRSGVDYEERYDFGDKPGTAGEIFEKTLVKNERRFTDAAIGLGRNNPPGSTFNYSTLDTSVLGLVLERAAGRSISDFMAQYLWGPSGMDSFGYWIADGKPGVGREMNGMGFSATLRDYARLGQLMLDSGKAAGQQIIPTSWVQESTRMIPFDAGEGRAGRRGYAYQWWQIDNSQAYAAMGLQGQSIYVDPASRTVIVKLSYYPPVGSEPAAAETLAFFRAVAEAEAKQH